MRRMWLELGIVVVGLPPLVQVQAKVTKKRSLQKYQALKQDKDSVKLTNKRILKKPSNDIKERQKLRISIWRVRKFKNLVQYKF